MENKEIQGKELKTVKPSMTLKGRSPNYPQINLQEAILRTEKLYESAKQTPVDSLMVVKLIGYAGLNGASRTVLSALKKYGLLEETPKGFRVSDLAIQILVDPKGSPDRNLALQKAAFSPSLNAEFWAQYGNQKVSDEILKAALLKRSFSREAAATAVANYRETVQFVEQEIGTLSTDSEEKIEDRHKIEDEARKETSVNIHSNKKNVDTSVSEQLNPGSEMLAYRLSSECTVKLIFDGPVTTSRIDKLIALLDLNKDAFPIE